MNFDQLCIMFILFKLMYICVGASFQQRREKVIIVKVTGCQGQMTAHSHDNCFVPLRHGCHVRLFIARLVVMGLH